MGIGSSWLEELCVYICVEVFGRSARVGVSWAFVHPVGAHVEDTWTEVKKSKKR